MNPIKLDLYRFEGNISIKLFLKAFLKKRAFRYIVYWRLIKDTKCIFYRKLLKLLFHNLFLKMSIEIPFSVKIGPGLLFIHPYGITINSSVKIGYNFTIMKGATIGNVKSGKRAGSPTIGNNVYVGLNSTIVGNVHIGNNVLVAANTFVNFDVPDNSIVIGAPGVIHPKKNASLPYINNSIENVING